MSESIKKNISTGQSIFKYKLVFIGDQAVGKTCIINRFIYDTYTGGDQPTVGIDFISKTLNVDNKTIRLQLWDTAGQERFRSLIPSYVRDSNVVIIFLYIQTFITEKQTFLSLDKWVQYVRDERGTDVIIAIVGNKCDLANERQVQQQEAQQKSQELGAQTFFEVSAKEGKCIHDLFKDLTSRLQYTKESAIQPNAASPQQQQQQSTGGQAITLNAATTQNKQLNDIKKCAC